MSSPLGKDWYRDRNNIFCTAERKRIAQSKRNSREWLRWAKLSIDAGNLEVAINQIKQSQLANA